MSVQYRKLTTTTDLAARGLVRDARYDEMKSVLDDVPFLRLFRSPQRAANYAMASVVARISATQAVDAAEGTASIEELGTMLTALKLAPSDLVNPGDGWRTLADFPPVMDEVDIWRRKARVRSAALFLGKWSLALVSIGGVLAGLWRYYGGSF